MATARFIVLGTQRAGTTLVRTCLDDHPAIRCIGETFIMGYRQELGYGAFCSASLGRRLRHRFDRTRLVREYLDYLYALPDCQAVGLKYMYNHTRVFPMVVPYVLENGVKVIHVVRENVLKAYVSRVVARERGRHHSQEELPVTRVSLPVDDLPQRLDNMLQQQREWRATFEHHTPYLDVSYERFTGERKAESARMLAFLGVEYAELESPMVKVNPDSLDEIVVNYEEVRAALQSSRHARWLDP